MVSNSSIQQSKSPWSYFINEAITHQRLYDQRPTTSRTAAGRTGHCLDTRVCPLCCAVCIIIIFSQRAHPGRPSVSPAGIYSHCKTTITTEQVSKFCASFCAACLSANAPSRTICPSLEKLIKLPFATELSHSAWPPCILTPISLFLFLACLAR